MGAGSRFDSTVFRTPCPMGLFPLGPGVLQSVCARVALPQGETALGALVHAQPACRRVEGRSDAAERPLTPSWDVLQLEASVALASGASIESDVIAVRVEVRLLRQKPQPPSGADRALLPCELCSSLARRSAGRSALRLDLAAPLGEGVSELDPGQVIFVS